MKMTSIYSRNQKGEVSLFVVIFSTLLISVITVSFVRLMITGQQQASNNDLSQSAYDSALAGVEDAKRSILRYQSVCDGGDESACAQVATNISSSDCNDSVSTLSDISIKDGEVAVQTNSNSDSLNQAYTCVKVALNTDDYLGSLSQDSMNMIPLKGASDFNTIKIEWFNSDNLGNSSSVLTIPAFANGTPLLSQSSWSISRPSVMRAQLIEFSNSGFKLADLDSTTTSASSNTLFLYPTNIIDTTKSFSSDSRGVAKTVLQIHCNSDLLSSSYACSATITLPTGVDSGHTAYLGLKSIYNGSNYRISLYNSSTLVQFKGVQPEIDSTGRANNLFRRVKARVSLVDINFPYPVAAVETTGKLCKNFVVTDNTADYISNCTP